jgi:large subunit ribosomal protein L4
MERSMKLKLYTKDGQFKEEREYGSLPSFDDCDRSESILKKAILAYRANLRQGTACAKKRDEVAGSGKKPWRQKGTGRARHGSKRSPIWTHGGVVFGPRPRDYSQKLSRKEKQLALKMSFFGKAQKGQILVIEEFFADKPQTKEMNTIVNRIFQEERKVLLIDDTFAANVALSLRNIEHVFLIESSSVNALEIMKYRNILFTERALQTLAARMNSEIRREKHETAA